MNPEQRLDTIVREVGEKYGFESIGAEFEGFRNMVVKWRRTNRWIRFKVSDYLADAPDEIFQSLARVLFQQISRERDKYPEDLLAWLTDPSFCLRNRETYLTRSPELTGNPKGCYKDLQESYARLKEQGLVKDDPDILICWNQTSRPETPSYYSVLMKTVALTDLLDDPSVPDYVIDWLVYHDLCIVQSGYKPYAVKRTVPIKVARRYPKMTEAQEFLDWFLKDVIDNCECEEDEED